MNTYFKNVQTLDELRKQYRDLLSMIKFLIKFFKTTKTRKTKIPASPLKSRLASILTYTTKQGMRESNSRQRFWRPLSYHLTNPLCVSITLDIYIT